MKTVQIIFITQPKPHLENVYGITYNILHCIKLLTTLKIRNQD